MWLSDAEVLDDDPGDVLPAASFFKKRFVSTRNAFTCHWLGAACTLATVKRMNVHERKTHSLLGAKLAERRPCRRMTDARI